jgi:crotonobetainyl-CoA:carnitine CoA-transferase CaiB-like acyl-CoA transferase
MTTETSSDPLAGIRVLDFSSMMAGPYCTRFMADLGAEVIKVEAPEGDYIRQRAPKRDGHSAYFGHLNAGKRSIVLDLKQPAALAAAHRLAERCDVLVQNFRPGTMERLGLGWEQVHALNPRLIYCSISGFGQTGPDAHKPAYAQIVQAASGYELAHAGYQDGSDRPSNIAIFIADVMGALFAHSGVLAALQHRNLTGHGQHVDSTLMESMLSLMAYEVQEAQFPAPERRPVYPPLKARDGYVMLAAVSPRNFEALLDVLDLGDWRADPMLATDAGRQGNWSAVMARVEDWTCRRSVEECERIIGGAGVPLTRYSTVREALQQPQFKHRGSLATVRDGAGTYLVPNLPFKLSAAHVGVRERVPELGEDTEQVLREIAGLTPDEVRAATQTGR